MMAELFNDPVLLLPDPAVLFEDPSCLLSRRRTVGSSILRKSRAPKRENSNHAGVVVISVGYLRL